MNYTSNFTTTDLEFEQNSEIQNKEWICAICEVVVLLLLLSSTVILNSFLRKARKNNVLSWSSIKNGRSTLLLLAIITCVTLMTSLLSTQAVIIITLLDVEHSTLDKACGVLKYTKHVSTILNFLSTNFFLWFRLLNLYKDISIRHLLSYKLKVSCIIAAILCFLSAVSFSFLLFSSYWVGDPPTTCKSRKLVLAVEEMNIVANVFLVLRISHSLIMFALLGYPLFIDIRKNRKLKIMVNEDTEMMQSTDKKIRRKLKLAAFGVLLCVISDIGTQMVNKYALPKPSLRALKSTIWDFNDYANVRSLLLCYVKYNVFKELRKTFQKCFNVNGRRAVDISL